MLNVYVTVIRMGNRKLLDSARALVIVKTIAVNSSCDILSLHLDIATVKHTDQ